MNSKSEITFDKDKIKIKAIPKKIIEYKNEGITLIFNKLITEYNLYINGILNTLNEKEIDINEKLSLLNDELSKSTFDKILSNSLEDEKDAMKSVIQDYYLYYITKNESLKREINDLEKLCELLEMICNFQFEINMKKDIKKNDLLNIIMWTNDYYSEINEFLFCVEYFHSGKYFNKKNIFKEILKKQDANIDIIKDDFKSELLGIKKGMEIILSVFNDLCLDFHDNSLTKNILEIIPTMYHINEKYKLNCKELYFLLQIKYTLKIYYSLNKDKGMNDENIFTKFLNCLKKYRNLYKDKNINNNSYDDLIRTFKSHISKDDKKQNRCLIKILIQEYKKRIKDDKFLDILLNILKENEQLMKSSQLLFHEILSQYFDGTEINIDKISDYNTNDHFLKLIGSFSNNEYIEQILLEVFESKFNAHFMSYTNEINKTINYENISDEKANEILKGKNLELFKKCIDLLEDQNIRFSNERFLPNIVYCAYIKSYLYQFISYVYKKSENLIDLSDVTKSLTDGNDNEFKTKERKVMEIYSFRILLEYLNNDYNAFKSFAFDQKYLTYKNSFKDKDSFDAPIPKIIEFCGRTIEDFIKIKGDTPLEPIDYQNFYSNTFLSIKIVCGAINGQGISIDANGYKEIWDYFSSKLNDKVNKFFNIKYNHNDMFMNYFLSDILIKNLSSKISNNEFKLGSFTNDLNLEHLNNKTLSMIIYIIRFCLHSYSVSGEIKKDGKENYFYSKLIDYNSQDDITNIISNNYIPGRMIDGKNKGIKRLSLKEFCLIDFENKDNIINEEPKIELISIVMLRFLFYSHLFVANLLGKISDSTFNSNYSITEEYTCLRMLISLWSTLNSEKLIPGNETNKVQIFLNRVNKEIAECYSKCEDFTNIENVYKFERHFNEYIKKCVKEYEYFKLIFVDNTMKAIIQQNNFPLSYGDDYPYMKYFVLISYPNMEHLKQKIKGKEDEKKLYLSQNMMEYDENLNDEKFKKIFENKLNNKFNMMLMDISTFSPYSYKKTQLFDLIINNTNILKKYYKALNKKGINYSIEEFNQKLIDLSNISNGISKKFLENFLNKLKIKNNYLYKNIRRPMLSQNALNDEYLLFDIKKISDYKSYTHFLSKYIYKDIFTENNNKFTDYIDFYINIDYNNYNTFDIEIEEFEDELESIILSNKRLFCSNDKNIISIYNFDTFRGKNYSILNDFIRQYKNGFEYINCQEQINKIIDINNNKNIIRIFICDIIDAYSILFENNFLEGNNKDFKELNNIMKEPLKISLINKIENNNSTKLKQQIVFNFIFSIYNNLLKIINFLIDKKISLEISISDFITNLPDIYNISFYAKYFFDKNKEFKLKHLYYIFEEFELYLFPFILLNVKDKYKTEINDEDKENIINYFISNNEESDLNAKEFNNALRKFISRYLVSSDFDTDKYDIYCDNPLINYLNKKDLWPLNITENNMDLIENGINDLKEFNFLVEHSVCLYQCLSGIKFENNSNIINEESNDIINESNKEKNIFNNLSYFNNKNSDICNIIKINSIIKEQDLSNSILFLFYNMQNNFIFQDISNENKSFIYLTYSNSGICSNHFNMIDHTIKKEKEEEKKENKIFKDLFEIKEISKLNNSNLNNIQNITHLIPLKDNDIYCIGTNNSKLMIIKLKDNFTNIELLQDIDMPESCVNNIEIFNGGQSLIVANGKHILLYELKENNNNFNTYELKKDITTENDTYILKIDFNTIAAFISPNIIRFYYISNNEFIIIKELKDINFEISSNNQKQFKTMNLVGKDNNIIAICSNEHNVYLIDLSDKKVKKLEINYERCSSNYGEWFEKHSSKQKKENVEEKKIPEANEKINKEEEINANMNGNDNKKIDYVEWFNNHSKNNVKSKHPEKLYDVVNCSMNECKNNFVSVIKLFGDYIFLLDNTNKVIVSLIIKNDEKIEKLKFIGEFNYHDIICYTPFGLYLANSNKA